MANPNEIREKESRAQRLMEREGLSALALSTIGNFAWLTCGANNYVGTASDTGVATAVITRDAKYVVTDNIEAGRIADEEIAGQGFEVKTYRWYEGAKDQVIRELAGGGALGSDVPMEQATTISTALDVARAGLTPEEIERYRWLGEKTGECIAEAARAVKPGMTEHEVAADLDRRIIAIGAVPTVTLIAADDRISKYRHPIPTERKVDRYVMLVIGARKWGLVVSATRIVHFGTIPPELRIKHEAVTLVDAAFIAGTKPGARVGDVFSGALEVYRATGFGSEWELHHQGGATGYKPREYRATTSTDAAVVENQAFAWNPSITGTKSEDTMIAHADGPEVLSLTGDWPVIEHEINGVRVKRPAILVG